MENPDLKQWIEEVVEQGLNILNALKKAPSMVQVYDIVHGDAKLRYVGEGSSRVVYEWSPTLVIKIINMKRSNSFVRGLEQNRVETSAWHGCGRPYKDLIAKVVDHHPEYFWILQEKVERALRANEKIYDMYLQDMKAAMAYYFHKHPDKMKGSFSAKAYVRDYMEDGSLAYMKKTLAKLSNNPKFVEILKLTIDCSLALGDVAVEDAWGVLPDGRPVLVDYGATNETIDYYYQ